MCACGVGDFDDHKPNEVATGCAGLDEEMGEQECAR